MKSKKSVSHRCGVIVLALLAIFGLATCAKNPVTGKRDFVLMSEEQEVKMGVAGRRRSQKGIRHLRPRLAATICQRTRPAFGRAQPPQ